MPQSGRVTSFSLNIMVTCRSRAMPCRRPGAAILEGGDRLAHERLQTFEEFIRRFIHADDKLLIVSRSVGNFLLEIFNL